MSVMDFELFPRKQAEHRAALKAQLESSERILVGAALIVGVQPLQPGSGVDVAFCGQALTSRTGSPLAEPMPVLITLAEGGMAIETWVDPESIKPDMVLVTVPYSHRPIGTLH